MGREPADLLITGGRLVNVHTREVLDGVDVAVKSGRIAMFGDAAHTRGPQTRLLDADGAHLVPGLIDTHMHVESAMVTVARFAEAVLPHGTTTVLIDNHEIANVLGLESLRCPALRTPARRSRPTTSARRSDGRASRAWAR
jgi:adenine deaminase